MDYPIKSGNDNEKGGVRHFQARHPALDAGSRAELAGYNPFGV